VALSALPAAGGCFCVALLLAIIADSDPGAVYEQHRWLGAVVAAGAVCAFAAMMGWATLRHGGVPAPVLLMALVVAGMPFALPGGLFLPGVATAVAACAVLAWAGLARPPASLRLLRRLSGGLALTALTLAIGQAIAVGLHDRPSRPRAAVEPSRALPHSVAAEPAATATPRRPDPGAASAHTTAPPTTAPTATAPAPSTKAPPTTAPRATAPHATAPPATAPEANAPSTKAPPTTAPRATAPSATAPRATAPPATAPHAVAPPATALPATPRRFVGVYYAALEARRFAAAWKLLAPGLRARFGGFAAWREGYKYTVANSPGSLRVTPAAGAATVGLTLRAGDRDACGKTVVRRFAVTWRLARTEAGWRATEADARAISSARIAESAAGC
jgi:hypothetical protein